MTAEAVGTVERVDPAFHAIATDRAQIQRILTGYQQLEAPFYSRDGFLLFVDVKRDIIRKWTPDGVVAEFRAPAAKASCITSDKQGQLVVCEAGNHAITWTNRVGTIRPKAEKLGKPEDVVFRSDGSFYFSDSEKKGVYRADADGVVKLLKGNLSNPKGVALSKDEKFLFVNNADPAEASVLRFELNRDGNVESSSTLFKFPAPGSDQAGGIELDTSTNVYATGPGGVFVLSPEGKHIGTLKVPEQPSGLYWGKYADTTTAPAMASAEYATTLYIAAGGSIYRVGLTAVGVRP